MPVVYVNYIKSQVFIFRWIMDGYKVIDKNRLLGLVVDFPMLITSPFSDGCIYQRV